MNQRPFIYNWAKRLRATTFAIAKLEDQQYQSNCKLQVYYMSTKNKFNVIYFNHIFDSHLSQPSKPILPSPLKLQNFTSLNQP